MTRVIALTRRPAAPTRGSVPLRRIPTTMLVLAACALAGGCAARDPNRSGLLEPYRIDLPQGNYLTQDTVAKVHEGMTREQVRFVLGTPLLNHVFHPERWDYVFRYQFPNGSAEMRKVTIVFQDERVSGIQADSLPAREDASDPALPGYRPGKTEPAPAKAVDKTADES